MEEADEAGEGDDESDEDGDEQVDDEDGDGWEECSDDSDAEDENDGDEEEVEDVEWETCSENEEGNEDDDKDAEGVTNDNEPSTASNHPRIRLDCQRILTPEDFSLLEKLKAAQRDRLADPRNRSKRKRSGDDSDDEEDAASRPSQPYAVTEDQIAPEAKVKKSTKIERLTRVLEGRVENRFVHEGHAGGLTNKEKQRKKNYVMIRKGKREVVGKDRRSNSEVRWQKSKRVSHDFLISVSSSISIEGAVWKRQKKEKKNVNGLLRENGWGKMTSITMYVEF